MKKEEREQLSLAKRQEATAKYKEAVSLTAQYIEQLAENFEKPETQKELQEFLNQFSDFYNYSYWNTYMVMLEARARGTQVSALRSFEDWHRMQNDKGERVSINAGEKSYTIAVPYESKLWQTDEGGTYLLDNDGMRIPALDENGNQMTTTRFTGGSVFDISQTNAFKIGAVKKLDYGAQNNVISEAQLQEIAKAIEKVYSIKTKFQYTKDNVDGYYYSNQQEQAIVINQRLTPTERLSTLFHELGHATMHNNAALKRYEEETGEKLNRGRKEAQAEAFSYVLSKHFGVDTKSELYIRSWQPETTADELKSFLQVVKDATADTIKRLPFDKLEIVKQDLPEVPLEGYNFKEVQKTISSLKEDKEVKKELHKRNEAVKYEQNLGKKLELLAELAGDINTLREPQPPKQVAEKTDNAAKTEAIKNITSKGGTVLDVQFKDRAIAKAAGAKFDGTAKTWYAPKNADLDKLKQFLPEKEAPTPTKTATAAENKKFSSHKPYRR